MSCWRVMARRLSLPQHDQPTGIPQRLDADKRSPSAQSLGSTSKHASENQGAGHRRRPGWERLTFQAGAWGVGMPSPVAAERIESRNVVWNAAAGRGGELARLVEAIRPASGVSWEWVGTRGVIATALYCLAHRDQVAVTDIGHDSVLFWLSHPVEYLRLVTTRLPAAGHDIGGSVVGQPVGSDGEADWARDPVVAQWRWLTRPWPASEAD